MNIDPKSLYSFYDSEVESGNMGMKVAVPPRRECLAG